MRVCRDELKSTVKGVGYRRMIGRVLHALREESFGALSQIDIEATLPKTLFIDFRSCVILAAYDRGPEGREPEDPRRARWPLPCNVVVQEAPGGAVVVSIGEPKAMFAFLGELQTTAMVADADTRLRRVIEAITSAHY